MRDLHQRKAGKKDRFFFGSTLIENLFPKKYDIEVRKNGYYSWTKALEIKEKEVTEAKNIVLIPSNPQLEKQTEGVENFWVSPDGKRLILHEESDNGWSLKLFDVGKNLKSQLINEDDIYARGADLNDLKWSKDSREVYLSVNLRGEETDYTLNIERLPPRLSKKEKPSALPENAVAYEQTDGALYYLDTQGFVYRKETAAGFTDKLSEKTLPAADQTDYKIWILDGNVFLKVDKNLYFFNSQSAQFEKIFDDLASDVKLSPDSRKAVYFSNSELWVYFLKEQVEEPKKKVGDRLFIARLSEKIVDCLWLNSDYLIFSAGNYVKVAELDDRDKFNIVDLVKFPNGGDEKNLRMCWSSNIKNLFVLDNGNLYKSAID